MPEMIPSRQASGQALVTLGERNSRVLVLEADLGRATMSSLFGQRFPDRYFEMGIAEANMMGVAAGLALSGWIPYASTFCVFASMRAGEQVRNSIAYPRLNVKIAATNAGIEIGADGVTHQAIEDIAILRAMPNMTVLVPSDPTVIRKAIHLAAEIWGPVYIRIGRQPTPVLYPDDVKLAAGGSLLLRDGTDVTLMAIGNMVCRALEAAETLAQEGISARVLDLYSVKPIDEEAILKAATETGCIVTAEDHNVIGGLGGAVAEVISGLKPVPLVRVGLQDTFAQSGEWLELLDYYHLSPRHIVEAAREVIARRDSEPRRR